jgi:hypothetical protein
MRRVLWIKLEIGGLLSPSWVPRALSWLKSLGLLRGEIKRWNLEVFGNVGARNKAWAEELELLDRSEEVRGLSEEEERRLLALDLEASLLQEEISWR